MSVPMDAPSRSLLIVGASVRGTVALERVVASLDELLPGVALHVHVVDPHPPGSGRIWRAGQPPSLVMNTVPAHSTVFTDASVTCDGPIVDGPTFAQWLDAHAGEVLDDPVLLREAAATRPWTSPSRALYGAYLRWAWERTLASVPANVTVTVHTDSVRALVPNGVGGYRAETASGVSIEADAVLLALGWLTAQPSDAETRLWAGVEDAGGVVIRPENPIDQRLDLLLPGRSVVARGLGMNFFDVLALTTQERGGQFVDGRYLASGNEPRFIALSRRGIPFNAKPNFCTVPPAPAQRHLRSALAELSLRARSGTIDFGREVRVLIDADATHDYYATLARVRPGAIHGPIQTLLDAIGTPQQHEVIAEFVPDPGDRLDLAALEHPSIPGFADVDEADAWVLARVTADIDQARLGTDSPIKAALWSIGAARNVVIPLVEFGGLTTASMLGAFAQFSAFAGFIASGPPLFRAEQLVALHNAGIVRFAGPGAMPTLVDGELHVAITTTDGVQLVPADDIVECRLDPPALRDTADPLLQSLVAAGLARVYREDELGDGGLDVAPGSGAVIRADGTASPNLFSVGVPSEQARSFTIIAPIPGANSTVIREIDAAARAALRSLARERVSQL